MMSKIMAFVVVFAVSQFAAAAPKPDDLSPATGQIIRFMCPSSLYSVFEHALREYNLRYGGKVKMERVSENVINFKLQMQFSYGVFPELFCTDPASASVHFSGGWIEPINRIHGYASIKKNMLPSIRKSVSHHDLLMGLPYAGSVSGVVVMNRGWSDVNKVVTPRNWSNVYRVAAKYTKTFAEPALIPAWSRSSIARAFVIEVMNRSGYKQGGELDLGSSFANDVLLDWLMMYRDGVVPPDSLGLSDQTALSRIKSGDYVFGVTELSHLFDKSLDGPGGDTGSNRFKLLSGWGQNWGMLKTYMVSMSKRQGGSESQAVDIRRFLRWFAYRDEKGYFSNSERFLDIAKLFPAYRSGTNFTISKKIMQSVLGDSDNAELARDTYSRSKFPSAIMSKPYSNELLNELADILFDCLNEALTVSQTIQSIEKMLANLKEKHNDF